MRGRESHREKHGEECRTERKSGGVVAGRQSTEGKAAVWEVMMRPDEEGSNTFQFENFPLLSESFFTISWIN